LAHFFAALPQKNRAFRCNSSPRLRRVCGIFAAIPCAPRAICASRNLILYNDGKRRCPASRASCPEALLPQTRFRVCLPGHAAKNPGRMGEQQSCLQDCDQPGFPGVPPRLRRGRFQRPCNRPAACISRSAFLWALAVLPARRTRFRVPHSGVWRGPGVFLAPRAWTLCFLRLSSRASRFRETAAPAIATNIAGIF
jgi:hypothetical protein